MARQFVFRSHAVRRMFQRGISVADIRGVIDSGEVFEDRPHDLPYPSRLVLLDRLQHLMPTLGGSDDRLRAGLPDERLGLCVVRLDKGVDRLLEVDDRMEHAVLEPPARELGKEALDGVQPSKPRRPRRGAGDRREAAGPTAMPGEPGLHLGGLVGGPCRRLAADACFAERDRWSPDHRFVEDDVDRLAGRHLPLDGAARWR